MQFPYSPNLNNLIQILGRLPGLGPKSASRIAFYLLESERGEALALADSLRQMAENTRPCDRCGFPKEEESCSFCDDSQRSNESVCIVERPQDILSIEKTGMYGGHYHSLGGLLSPVEGVELEDLRIESLWRRFEADAFGEALLALSPTMEGEATALYLAKKLKEKGIKTMRLSLGIPMGSSIEFADTLSLSRAIAGRIEL